VCALFTCRFLESEVDLDVAIKELHVLATAPGLYGDFVKLNAVRTLGKSLPPTLLSHLVSCLVLAGSSVVAGARADSLLAVNLFSDPAAA
jgi:hypothetical protein